MQTAYIIDALRIPRARLDKSGGCYAHLKPVDLLKPLFEKLVDRHQFDAKYVDDVLLGCSTQAGGQGANIGKIASLYAGWPNEVSGATVSRFCCSGLDAINLAASKILSSMENLVVAGGVEQLSQVPMFSDKGAWFSDPKVIKKTQFIHMGVAADLIANQQGYFREQLEAVALQSHLRAQQAINKGLFNRSIVPVVSENGQVILHQDNAVRETISIESLAKLTPHFAEAITASQNTIQSVYPNQTVEARHTAGSSPGLVDGASLLLLASKRACQDHQLTPRAKITSYANASDEPVKMLTGHIRATEKLLKLSKLKAIDIDYWEVNESFAASVLKYQHHFNINPNQLNANGGAIALGHPLGATGGNLVSMLLDHMESQSLQRGIVSICGGAGVGVATLIDRDV